MNADILPKETRPLVTFVLLTYNQDKYVREAVNGALAQNYTPLEIIVSDDCSTDSTFEIASRLVGSYSGPHEVHAVCNSENLGVCAHLNDVVVRARGELLILAGGDDISEHDRVLKVVQTWARTDASAVYSNASIIDASGQITGEWKLVDDWPDGLVKIGEAQDVMLPKFYGAGGAYARRLFSEFGPLPTDIRNEDYNLAWRAMLDSGIAYIPEKLLRYRKHDENLSFWVKISNAESMAKRIEFRNSMFKNELLNLRHAAGYAAIRFGNGSPVVEAIDKLAEKLQKKITRPVLGELIYLLVTGVTRVRFGRWLVNKLQ